MAKRQSAGKAKESKDKKKIPPQEEPKDTGQVEAHLTYLVKVLTEGSLYQLGKKSASPVEGVAIMMAQAVINDLKANADAHKDGAQIMSALGKIVVPYLDSLAKKGGGGGGDDEGSSILQGP